MSARINIHRLSSINSFLYRMKVFIDGQLVYKLSDGETTSGDLTPGEHEIKFKLGISMTTRIMVEDGHEYNYSVSVHPILPTIEFKPMV